MRVFEMLLIGVTVLSLSLYYKLISVALPLWVIYLWTQTGHLVTLKDIKAHLKRPIPLILLLLVFWAALTLSNSEHVMRSLRIDGQIALLSCYIVLIGLLQQRLNTRQYDALRTLWITIYLDALYVIAVETLLRGKIGNVVDRFCTTSHTNSAFMIKPSVTCMGFLAIPLIYHWMMQKKYIPCLGVWFFLVALSKANGNETTLMLLAATPFVFLGIYVLGRYFFTLAKIGLIAGISFFTVFSSYFITAERLITLTSPFIRESKMESLAQRFDMWEFATTIARKNPLKGLGIGMSKYAPGGDALTERGFAFIQLHPHNNIVQVWLEIGYVGLILWGAIIYFILCAIQKLRTNRAHKAMYGTLFVTVFVTSNVSYSAWHTFWLSSLVMLWMVCAFYTQPQNQPK